MDAGRRLIAWIRALGTAVSQLWHVLVVGPAVIALGGDMPDPDETFSAMLGRRSADGVWWAKVLATIVDVLMWGIDGGRRGHCRRAFELHRRNDR
jgi:hypothetical protein